MARSLPSPTAAVMVDPVTVAVGAAAGNVPQQEVTTFGSIGVNLAFGRGDQVQFSVDGRAPEAAFLDELATDVWITGRFSQRFRITQLTQAWDADGGDQIQIVAVSYKRLFNSRHVGPGGLTFTGVDQGDIVWGLIDHAQAAVGGDLGITKGASTTGTTRIRNYVEGDNIGDMAENLQNVIGGLWWDVDDQLVYTARAQTDFARKPTPLQLGATVRAMTRESSGNSFANVVYGDATEELIPVWVATPDLADDPRGRWEKAFGWPTVTEQSTLEENVRGELANTSSPASVWRIELEPSRWTDDVAVMPGDYATLVVPRSTAAPIGPGGGHREIVVQVSESSISFDRDGAVSLALAVIEVREG